MTLFQFLRYVLDITPIALFDIQGNIICKVKSKQNINPDLLDYTIFRIGTVQAKDYFDTDCYLCICLEK